MKSVRLFFVVLFFSFSFLSNAQPKVEFKGDFFVNFEQYLNSAGSYVLNSEDSSTDYKRKELKGFDTFQITRSWLICKAQPAEKISFNLTLDTKRLESGDVIVFPYYAYAEISDLLPNMKLRVGLQPDFWYTYSLSDYWRYRFVDTSYSVYWQMLNPSDTGIGFLGKALDDHLEYHFTILNGEGFKKEEDRFKEYSGRITGRFGNQDSLRASVSLGYSSHRYNNSDDFLDDVAMAGVSLDFSKIHLAGEYLIGTKTVSRGEYPLIQARYPKGTMSAIVANQDKDKFLDDDDEINYGGYALYFDARLIDKLSFFGRYDFYDPNMDSEYDDDSMQMYTMGIAYKIADNTFISLDYRKTSFEEKNLDQDSEDELEDIEQVFVHWKFAF